MLRRLALVTALALAVAAGGCGGADDEGQTDESASVPAQTTVAQAPGDADAASGQPAGEADAGRDPAEPDPARPGDAAPDSDPPAGSDPALSPEAERIAELAERGKLADAVRERMSRAVQNGEDPHEALQRLRERYGDALAELRGAGGDRQPPEGWGFGDGADPDRTVPDGWGLSEHR